MSQKHTTLRAIPLFFLFFGGICIHHCFSQNLSLKTAIEQGVANYGALKAKKRYAQAAVETIVQVKREYLPNLNVSAQQSFGTINGQNGPLYGLGGLGVASSGLPLDHQSWNAAFGALYLVNVNWEFFNFHRTQQRISVAQAEVDRFQKDYEQELFQHQVKIAAAYLNLLASQRLLNSQQKNLERTEVVYRNVSTRAKNGLLPGVDTTIALAENSKARITLNQVREQVKIQNHELVILLGIAPQDLRIDTTFISKIPTAIAAAEAASDSLRHPSRQFFQSRIAQSRELEKLFKKEYMPTFTAFGIYQTRASGFRSDYAQDQNSFTQNYFTGILPSRQNYLFGVGVVWNLTSIKRAEKKISYQKLLTQGLEEEYKAVDLELRVREDAANARLGYALQNFREAPIQVNAATRVYLQQLARYNNGLADLIDVTTALFTLNRAETDRDVAFTNVWQALLMKAAATGDFGLFINEF
jgi:outer membrane protein TolC